MAEGRRTQVERQVTRWDAYQSQSHDCHISKKDDGEKSCMIGGD